MIVPFLLSRLGMQIAAVVAICGVLVTSCVVRDRKLVAKGADRAVAQINKQTDKINEKARKARRAARAPGSVERVRKLWCRDCD